MRTGGGGCRVGQALGVKGGVAGAAKDEVAGDDAGGAVERAGDGGLYGAVRAEAAESGGGGEELGGGGGAKKPVVLQLQEGGAVHADDADAPVCARDRWLLQRRAYTRLECGVPGRMLRGKQGCGRERCQQEDVARSHGRSLSCGFGSSAVKGICFVVENKYGPRDRTGVKREMRFAQRNRFTWRLRQRSLPLGERTLVMGIVNLTPDSFSGDGLAGAGVEAAVERACEVLDAGADILDVGAESTRPGAEPVTAELEQERLLPVLEALLKRRPEAVVSVDSYHAATVRAAAALGAEIINDVSGLQWDCAMAAAARETGCGLVLMHTRGRPPEWKTLPALSTLR